MLSIRISAAFLGAAIMLAQSTGPLDLSHGLGHMKELELVRLKAAPSPEVRKRLDGETQTALKETLAPVSKDSNLPKATLSAVKELSRQKNIGAMARSMEDASMAGEVKTALVAAGYSLEDSMLRLQQVLTTHVPAFSIPEAPPGAGLSNISACQGGPGFYPGLARTLNQYAVQIRKLSESVGRIERRVADQAPELLGTAFVVDRQKGLVATACHVVDAFADFKADNNTWVVRGGANGIAPKILLDFGWGDSHHSVNEYPVEDVAFVPSVDGCDGALLRVNTAGRELPADLAAADAEPLSLSTEPLDVFSIGYPGASNAAVDTPATISYFNCIRLSAPGVAKFVFGGEVTRDEPKNNYHILTHLVPTVGGQSGSPIIDATDMEHPRVIGIHICCAQKAVAQFGLNCERRAEIFLQEAVSIADLLRLYRQQTTLGN